MPKFKNKKDKGSAEISTASLPDIIFMLLFFFMVTTVMRETPLKVKIDLPSATETIRLEDRSLLDYIYVGKPFDERFGTLEQIQLNDQFAELADIQTYVMNRRSEREARGEEAMIPSVTTVLKIDEGTKMGIISDIKSELREVQALKLNYSTLVRNE